MIGFSRAMSGIGFDAAIEARQAAAELFAVLSGALPFFLIGNERPVFLTESRDLQFVRVGIGKVNASLPRRAQPVFGAKVTLIGAAAGRDQLEHPVKVFLADVECHMHRAAVPPGAIGKRGHLLYSKKLMIGKFEKMLPVDLAGNPKAERFAIELFG